MAGNAEFPIDFCDNLCYNYKFGGCFYDESAVLGDERGKMQLWGVYAGGMRSARAKRAAKRGWKGGVLEGGDEASGDGDVGGGGVGRTVFCDLLVFERADGGGRGLFAGNSAGVGAGASGDGVFGDVDRECDGKCGGGADVFNQKDKTSADGAVFGVGIFCGSDAELIDVGRNDEAR